MACSSRANRRTAAGSILHTYLSEPKDARNVSSTYTMSGKVGKVAATACNRRRGSVVAKAEPAVMLRHAIMTLDKSPLMGSHAH